jgi:hypothetical protein
MLFIIGTPPLKFTLAPIAIGAAGEYTFDYGRHGSPNAHTKKAPASAEALFGCQSQAGGPGRLFQCSSSRSVSRCSIDSAR